MQQNVDAYKVLETWRREWKPDCTFSGSSVADFEAWKKRFRRHYRQCLGPWPQRVPLNLEIVGEKDCGDHVRQKIAYDSSPGVRVPAYLLVPKGLERGERRPGILAAHGHGAGKGDAVGAMPEEGDARRTSLMERLNYQYGLDAVRRGYIVIAPDWLPFGERRPSDDWIRTNRDACNVVDLAWQYFGRPLITQNIWDGMRAVDVMATHANVDRKRLAVIGLSYGGTMATHLLINDRRLRTGVVSGYLSTVRADALNMRGRANTCGAQHVPGLLRHGDIPDMLGLACPKPVLFEMGRKETCFHFPDTDRAYRYLRQIYRAAGALDRIARDAHPHDHRWSGDKAWQWLERRLA